MTTIPDSELFVDADRVKNKVVVITGAANGIGKSAALYFARHGAKVVIGDLDIQGAEKTVGEIRQAKGDAISQKCDVTIWEQQLSLFQLAMETFGHVDIVVPNAGLTERGGYSDVRSDLVNGVPKKPDLKTLEVDLIGVLYTARLALFYLLEDYTPDALKSIVFIGSMSTFEAIPGGALYSTSKHAALAVMSSLHGQYNDRIRFGIVCPWFADTAIVPTAVKLFMAGIPLTPIARVGGAIFKAATDRNPASNGGVYTLPDEGEVFRIDRPALRLDKGVYKMINDRADVLRRLERRGTRTAAVIKDVTRIIGPKLFSMRLIVAIAVLAWYRATLVVPFLVPFLKWAGINFSIQ
ncbi:hypothetical protein M422DRAFT_28053 [Sphaerobolus stellatus SS14]|nr:hypothetical protein M422DRAFT_28053 [Sphaerobolus stellatus SS14]